MKKHIICIFLISSLLIPSLISPSDGAELNYIHILFEWEQQPDAVEYNIQASNSPSFDNLFFDINNLSTVYIEKDAFIWDSNIYWRVKSIYIDGSAGDWIGSSSFSIGEKQFPERDADIYNENLIQDGLIAFSGFAPEFASAVIDKYGNEIWNSGEPGVFDFMINHINDYGNIYGQSFYNYPYNSGTKVNYDIDFLWSTQGDLNDDGEINQEGLEDAIDIHEIKQIPNGNYMAFVPDYQLGPIPQGPWSFYYEAVGYVADGITNEYPWKGMRIVEWDVDGNEVWNWNPFEHFTMNDYDAYAGIWWDFNNGTHDWMHSNAFHFDEEESMIYVSHRHLSRISKIAYPSGEVIWNMGMPEGYHTGSDNICTDLGNSFQHNIQLLDDGTLLFFDNGNLSEMLMGDSNPTSRIRRIRVIDDTYCETVWQYDLPQNLYGLGMGSVQLLDNGNYLLYTFGNGFNQGEPTLREVTSNHEVVWNYQGISNAAWYRTYKIPSLHPDAFSVIADNYTLDENNNNIIQISGNALDFTIINKSGYSLPYRYMFSDLMDGGDQLFIYDEGSVDIEPYGSAELSFTVNSDAEITSTQIMLAVWPDYHEYALKELMFSVSLDSTLGDVNSDNSINILDVVIAIDMVLNDEYSSSADLDSNGIINILDIVQLVNLILD